MDIKADIKRALGSKFVHTIQINGEDRKGLLSVEPGSFNSARRKTFTVSYSFMTYTDEISLAYMPGQEALIKAYMYTLKNVVHDEWGMAKLWFGEQRSPGETKKKESEFDELGL